MTPKCRAQIQQAAGTRKISDAKLAKIEEMVSRKMTDLARQDRQRWLGLTKEQRVTEAAKAAMDELQAVAARSVDLAAMQVTKTAETGDRIANHQAIGRNVTRSQAFAREMQDTHNYTHSLHDEAVTGLTDLLDAAANTDGTGRLRALGMKMFDLDNPQMTADVVREVFKNADGHTGNPAAKAGARSWLDTIESLRVRFNAAGGDVGKLGYGYLSQSHDSARIMDVNPQAWAAKVLPLLDRAQYLKPDGSVMSDAELSKVLEAVHATLASNGLNKVEPGGFKGAGKRANSGSDRRVLHFKDGDSWMGYMKDFGEGSLYDAMLGHIGHMTRNIGLVERYGPNPETQFRLQADLAQRADGAGSAKNRAVGNTPQAYWDIISGKTSTPENEVIANAFQDLRNVQTAAKLGSAVISSMTDVGTIAHTLNYNRLPYFAMLQNLGRNLDKDHRAFLQAHGVIAEHLTSTLNRWTGDNMTHSLTGRVAASVMKLSFMNAWTDGLRSAFSATLMQGFAGKIGKSWAKLDEWDRWLMGRKGITEADWGIISQAKPTERGDAKYLTRESIMDVDSLDVEKIIPGRLDAISQRVKAEVKTLDDRNAQDSVRILGRIDKIDEIKQASVDRIKKFAASKDAQAKKAGAALKDRADLLSAEIEQAQNRADIDAYLATETQQEKIRDFLWAVAEGSDIERGVMNVRTNPDNYSDSVVDVISNKKGIGEKADLSVERSLRMRGSIGEKLGRREGSIKRRIIELEARVRNEESAANTAVRHKIKDHVKKIDDARAELGEYVKKSMERQRRRQAVIDRISASEQPQIDAAILDAKRQAATKWMAFVSDESQFAVVNPDLATRAIVTGGGMPAGTIKGEAMRSFMQFKSFPFAMMTRHWGRLFDTPQGLEGAPAGFGAKTEAGATMNRIAVLAGLNVSLMMLGAIVIQEKSILNGKDPQDMSDPKFWTKALAQGGGMGYMGDMLTKDPTEQRGNNFEQALGSIAGPTGGAVGGLVGDVMFTNAWQAAKGTDTNAAAETLRWTNSQMPFTSLWQVRAAWNNWFIYNAQEAVNPGYLGRMKSRAMRDYGQDYFWEPGEAFPERAPDMGAAVGQ